MHCESMVGGRHGEQARRAGYGSVGTAVDRKASRLDDQGGISSGGRHGDGDSAMGWNFEEFSMIRSDLDRSSVATLTPSLVQLQVQAGTGACLLLPLLT